LIRAVLRVKRHHIYTAGAVHREVQVVWHDELVILGQAPPQRDSFGVAVEALMGLVRPGEKEATCAPVLQAVQTRAMVEIWQALLDSSGQTCDAQLLVVVPSPARAAHVRADHFAHDWANVRVLVNGVLLMLPERRHCLPQRSLSWLDARDRPLDHRNRLEVLSLRPPLEPAQDVS
jgi:hypothetical protein